MLTRFEQFAQSISCIQRHIQKIERDEMTKYGLKGSYAQYLLAIRRAESGITSVRLCEALGKDKAAISRVVADMEGKGLVYRQLTGDNLYRAMLKLTDRGYEITDQIMAHAALAVEAAGKGLSEENRTVLYSSLGLIAENLHTISKDGIPNA